MSFIKTNFAKIASIAEIFVVLILGNLIASGLLNVFITPDTLSQLFVPSENNGLEIARVEFIRLITRFGILLAIGFGILWWRFRITPKSAGVSTGNHSLLYLIGYGFILFCVAGLPWKLIAFFNTLIPSESGLHGWDDIMNSEWNAGVFVLILVRATVIPPLLEEPLARGYILTRLGKSFGPMDSVVLSAIVFMMSHGHFYKSDPIVIFLLIAGIFHSVAIAYVTLRIGSVIPAIVSHSLLNLPEPLNLTGSGLIVLGMLLTFFVFNKKVLSMIRLFYEDWLNNKNKKQLLTTSMIIIGVFVSGALVRPIIIAVLTLCVLIFIVDSFGSFKKTE